MYRKTMTALLVVLSYTTSTAQSCFHKSLSRKYNFTTSIHRFNREDDVMDSCIIRIVIKNKATQKQVQAIQVKSDYMFASAFTHCNDVRSYVTGKNAKRRVVDNDFGDFIVVDLNFDGREDLAVKRDSGGNGGPLYQFYSQNKNRK